MKETDYPALYRAANEASIEAQRQHLGCVRGHAFLLIFGAGLGVYGIESSEFAAYAAILFLGALFLSIYMAQQNFENIWYRSRAVAESIKTSTWRYMMRAEPFDDASKVEEVNKRFRNMLSEIIKEHKDLAPVLGGEISSEEQITAFLTNTRSEQLKNRINFYREHRIDEQRTWYAKKSGENKTSGMRWLFVLVGLQGSAICLVLLRIVFPEFKYWPTEVFVVAAAVSLTWIQVKRFRELTASYGLAAHEIGVIKGELTEIGAEDRFSEFVRDAENAFSREHTQWVARKDS